MNSEEIEDKLQEIKKVVTNSTTMSDEKKKELISFCNYLTKFPFDNVNIKKIDIDYDTKLISFTVG